MIVLIVLTVATITQDKKLLYRVCDNSEVTVRISELNCYIGCAVESIEQDFRSNTQSSSIACDVLKSLCALAIASRYRTFLSQGC